MPPWLKRIRLALKVTEPGCGGCGYPMRGWGGGQCPECGADRSQTAPVVPFRHDPYCRRFTVWVPILVLTAAAAMICWDNIHVKSEHQHQTLGFRSQQFRVHADSTGVSWGSRMTIIGPGKQPDQIWIEARVAASRDEWLPRDLHVAPGSLWCRFESDDNRTHEGPLNRETIMRWLDLQAPAITAADRDAIAGDLETAVRAAAMGKFAYDEHLAKLREGGAGGGIRAQSSMWLCIAVWGPWFALLALGSHRLRRAWREATTIA